MPRVLKLCPAIRISNSDGELNVPTRGGADPSLEHVPASRGRRLQVEQVPAPRGCRSDVRPHRREAGTCTDSARAPLVSGRWRRLQAGTCTDSARAPPSGARRRRLQAGTCTDSARAPLSRARWRRLQAGTCIDLARASPSGAAARRRAALRRALPRRTEVARTKKRRYSEEQRPLLAPPRSTTLSQAAGHSLSARRRFSCFSRFEIPVRASSQIARHSYSLSSLWRTQLFEYICCLAATTRPMNESPLLHQAPVVRPVRCFQASKRWSVATQGLSPLDVALIAETAQKRRASFRMPSDETLRVSLVCTLPLLHFSPSLVAVVHICIEAQRRQFYEP